MICCKGNLSAQSDFERPAICYASVRNPEFPDCYSKIMSLIKIQKKGQFTIPTAIRSRLGLADGDFVEVSIQATSIVLTPKLVIDRSKFPNADDEYTPSQRRKVNARLAKSDADIKRGRVHGPFNSAEEMAASIEAGIKKLGKARTTVTSRR
jgi:AbrB family looped-hinge helix DNA binding protein